MRTQLPAASEKWGSVTEIPFPIARSFDSHQRTTKRSDAEKIGLSETTQTVENPDSARHIPLTLPPAAKVPSITPSSYSNVTYPEGGLRAWLVVLGSFCGMFACFGLMNTIGALEAYLSTHQLASYSSDEIGWIFSTYIFLAFFCGLLIGPVFDAHGPRWLVFAGSVLLVGGTFGMANATTFVHFILSFSIAAGIGTALIFTPAISAIAHFFAVRRGLATGLAATGGSVGGVLFPLIMPGLFEKVGWEWTMRILAFLFVFLLIFANLLIRRRLPPKSDASVWPDFRIFADATFAITTAGVFLMEWGLFIPLTYVSSWTLAIGVGDATFSYQILAILNSASFFGRWVPGYLADRIGRFNTAILAMGLSFFSIIALWLPGSINDSARGSMPLAVIFALVFGFATGSGISLTPVCVGELCRTEEYGRYYATCYTVVSFGCLTGVPIAGALLKQSGGQYGGLIAFTCTVYALCLACFMTARVRMTGLELMVVK